MEYIQKKYILKPLKFGRCYKIEPNFSKVKLESTKMIKICIKISTFSCTFFPLNSRWFEVQVEVDFLNIYQSIMNLWRIVIRAFQIQRSNP
jgi:predicted membrane protein